jgi:CTP synthase (UTP-ammonia lyase)
VIVPLSCSLVEESGTVIPESGSRLASYCGSEPLRERYHCRYGVAESHLRLLAGTGLRVGARDSAGEVRAVELDDHPYFLATLFQPERAAFEGRAHPLIAALVGAVTAASPSATAVRPFR